MTDWYRDRIEIFDLFNRYADALDHRRWELLEEIFTEDVATHWFEQVHVSGRAEVIRFIRDDFISRVARTHHLLGNYTATISGDRADASVRVRAYHAGAGERQHLFEESLGSFTAHVIRTEQGWRIQDFSEALYVMLGTQDVFGSSDPR